MHFGKRLNVPVVKTSTAVGREKLGSLKKKKNTMMIKIS